jgi:hypothetical protein
MKVVGGIAQGTHFSAGQELAVNFLMQHAVLKNCLFVSGDGWESYLGACGWTACDRDRNALKNRLSEKDRDAELAMAAARSLGIRAVELALIIQQGALMLKNSVLSDPAYDPYLENLDEK